MQPLSLVQGKTSFFVAAVLGGLLVSAPSYAEHAIPGFGGSDGGGANGSSNFGTAPSGAAGTQTLYLPRARPTQSAESLANRGALAKPDESRDFRITAAAESAERSRELTLSAQAARRANAYNPPPALQTNRFPTTLSLGPTSIGLFRNNSIAANDSRRP